MIYFVSTLEELGDAVQSFIKAVSSNTSLARPALFGPEKTHGLDDLIQLELIVVDKDFNEIGDEANDNSPDVDRGEKWAVKIS